MKPSEMSDEQLTKAVAEEVMGWFEEPSWEQVTWCRLAGKQAGEHLYEPVVSKEKWQPLTDPHHWMMVVERMRELGWWFRLLVMPSSIECEFYKLEGDCEYASGYEIGRAVLEAALSAVRAALDAVTRKM